MAQEQLLKPLYVDQSAASPVDPRVIEAMLPHMLQAGNPSSMHSSGMRARKSLEAARKQVADLVGATKQDEIIFTSGATESTNLAIKGAAVRNSDKGKHVIILSIEHMSVLNTCKELEKSGFAVTKLPVDKDGLVDTAAVQAAITPQTILVSIAYANGEVGTVQPIAQIGKILRERKTIFHVDGTAAVGKIPVNVAADSIDLLTIPSNDIGGPQGVGALYVRSGVKVAPIMLGGGQERGLRSGTENIAGIAGLGAAAQIAKAEMASESARLSALRDQLISELLKIEKSSLNGHPTKRLPNNVNVRFSYIEGESLVLNLDMAGIEAATSSACSSKTLEPSHVLLAMGISHAESQGALLVTMGRKTTREDIARIAQEVPKVVKRLRDMSPIAAHPELLEVAYEKEDHGHDEEGG